MTAPAHIFLQCVKCNRCQLDGVDVEADTKFHLPEDTLTRAGIHDSCAQEEARLNRAAAKHHALLLRGLAAIIEEVGRPLPDNEGGCNITSSMVEAMTRWFLRPPEPPPSVLHQEWAVPRRMPG